MTFISSLIETCSRATRGCDPPPSPRVTSHQLHLLDLMAASARLSRDVFFDAFVRRPGVTRHADLDQVDFDVIADSFVGVGFRHPALPILSRVQRACLLRCCHRLGLSRPAAREMFRDSTGVSSIRRMTGSHFLGLMAAFDTLGAGEPLPAADFMDRRRAMALRRRAWLAGIDEGRLRELMAKLGGTVATRGLDEHGYNRVTAALGSVTPPPPPRVDGDPGMMTQAQANLVWRLWLEARRGQDASWGKLDLAIRLLFGLPGGVDTLTRAGARAMLDRLAESRTVRLDLSGPCPAVQLAQAGERRPS